MAFSEFYADFATGANINAGDATANGVVTSTNGAWSTVTNIFTATAGTPFSGVSVGDFASLYLDGGTLSVYVARVTTVGGGGLTLTLSSTAKSGTAPTTAGIGVSCTTGGKWKGPNAAVAFPFAFVQNTMTNVAGDAPRINIKNGTTYSITAAVTHANTGPIRWQGYTSAAGDGGRAIIDGGTSGASYVLLTTSCNNNDFVDLTVQNNGASGSATGLSVTGSENVFLRCVCNSVRGNGIAATVFTLFVECETYACNQSNTAALGGFFASTAAGTSFVRCIAHDNTGSNSFGFGASITTSFFNCIADTNGGIGFQISSATGASVFACDAYNNTSDGIRLSNTSAAPYYIENCNLVKNGGYGINGSGAGTRNGSIVNCGFGAGTQVNTSGTTTGLSAMVESGSVTYNADATPWVDPANGDFRITLAASFGTGRGTFTQTAASYAGTIAYPDIGAATHLSPSVTTGEANGPGYIGDYALSSVIDFVFSTRSNTGVPTLLTGLPAVTVYKANGTTESSTGVTLTASFDSVTGLNHVRIDTSADGSFYASGGNFSVTISGGTVGGISMVGCQLARFTLLADSALKPTTAGTTLDVSATGEAGLDFNNIKDATGAHTLTNIRVPNVTLTDTVTTYTGNTLQTGDSFARIGATGSGLTSLAPSATALSTVNWTTARAGYLDNINNAALQTTAAQTGDAYAQTNSGTFGLAAIKGYVDDIGVAGAGLTALGDTRIANLDALVSSRMATYTQPTGFLAATFPAGTVANTTNITGGTITTATNLTNAPTAGDLTATMKASVTTAATASTPTIAGTQAFNNTGTWTGNIVGTVSTVTTTTNVTTVNGLAANVITAASLAADAGAEIAAAVRTELTAELARIDVAISTRGTGAALDAAGVRSAVGLASANLDTQLDALPTNAELATALATVSAQITTDHGSGSYVRNTEPDNTGIAAVKAKTDNLPSDPADASDIAGAFSTVNATLGVIAGYIDTEVAAILAAVDTEVGAIKAKTDQFTFTMANKVDATADLTTQAKADVNAEVVDVARTDTVTEIAAVPAANAPMHVMVQWLYTLARNKITQTALVQTLRNDADSANIATADVSDDGTTFTRSKWAS